MSNVEEFPVPLRRLTEYEALVAAGDGVLDAIPGAVYLCDSEGRLARYNREAVELWGREPALLSPEERFCGSHRLFLADGTPLPHANCPMAEALHSGKSTRNQEVVIERPDGERIIALVNIRTLFDHDGCIQGAINCFQDITVRKSMEEQLRRTNDDLEDFFQNAAVALHVVSSEGIILKANPAELDLLGYAAEEYVGRHIAEFHADASVIGDILQRLLHGERLERYPARLRAKDGSLRDVLITSTPRFVGGKFVSTRCFTTDVTDLRRAESERRQSEERLAATYEAATVAIAEADENGRLLRVNDALCKILGRPREELLSISFFEFTHHEDRDADLRLYDRQVRGEIDNYSIRKRVQRPDGSMAFLDVFSSSVRDANSRFLHGVRVIQDVTEAKHMEDRLREREQHLRELLEALPAAVYTTDAQGRINFFNKAAVELAGRPPAIGDEWCVSWRLHWPDGTALPHDQCPMAISLKEDRPIRGAEAVAERPDGTLVPFMAYPTPLHDAGGKLVGAINMMVDITERKQAEARQRTLIAELNHRVKNTLATIQSLSMQTARHAQSLDDFVKTFEVRLFALARAHDLLTRRTWQDAPLQILLHELVAHFAGGDHIRLDGPAVDLNPRAALSMTMALNELATNAAKYGALSSDAGLVSINWRIDEDAGRRVFVMDWVERGGPPVTPPARRGFGTRLVERCIEGDLDGELDLAFEPDGVSCRVVIPAWSLERRV